MEAPKDRRNLDDGVKHEQTERSCNGAHDNPSSRPSSVKPLAFCVKMVVPSLLAKTFGTPRRICGQYDSWKQKNDMMVIAAWNADVDQNIQRQCERSAMKPPIMRPRKESISSSAVFGDGFNLESTVKGKTPLRNNSTHQPPQLGSEIRRYIPKPRPRRCIRYIAKPRPLCSGLQISPITPPASAYMPLAPKPAKKTATQSAPPSSQRNRKLHSKPGTRYCWNVK